MTRTRTCYTTAHQREPAAAERYDRAHLVQWSTAHVSKPSLPSSLQPVRRLPALGRATQQLAWRHQAAALRQLVDQPMFGEDFSLAQVFVPLRAYWEKREKPVESTSVGLGGQAGNVKRVVVELEEHLDEWIESNDKEHALRVISGGPGSGKSAFAKMFAAQRAALGDRVLLVPLHLFDVSAELDKALRTFVEGAGILSGDPLGDDGGGPLLIIFDGLDELEKQGKAAEQTAREFVEHVLLRVRQLNQASLRLRALITGRDLAVQAVQNDVRGEGMVLHLLPYNPQPSSANRRKCEFELDDPQGIARTDQRDVWWARYGLATGRNFERMPDALRRRDLDEITSQPLLCYLVAMSWVLGKIDFTRTTTRSVIYRDLLEAVFNRTYDKAGTVPGARRLELEEFVLVLEEIGLATWQGDGRTTSQREIEAHCSSAGLKPLLEKVAQGAASGVTVLIPNLPPLNSASGRRVAGARFARGERG